jgi:hypothetical protein
MTNVSCDFSVQRKFSLIHPIFIFQHVNVDDLWVPRVRIKIEIKIKIKMEARAVSLLPKWKLIETFVTCA